MLMNVQAIHARIQEHVLMQSMAIHVHVWLGLLEQTVKQVTIPNKDQIKLRIR